VNCPCVRGEVCLVRRKEAVPATVPNFFTKTQPQKCQPDYIRDRIVSAHAKWNQQQRGRSVQVAETADEAEIEHAQISSALLCGTCADEDDSGENGEPYISFGGELAYL